MCEVEISDSSIVEVVDTEQFNDIGGVPYNHYEVGVGDDQYEEVCETEDSQGLMMGSIEDGNIFWFASFHNTCINLIQKSYILAKLLILNKTCFVRFADEVILQSEADLQGHEEVLDASGDPLCVYGDVSSLGNEIYIESSSPGPSRYADSVYLINFIIIVLSQRIKSIIFYL